MRSLADSPGGAEDWIVEMLCTHYADQGRAADGLAYLDTLKKLISMILNLSADQKLRAVGLLEQLSHSDRT